MNQPTRTFTDSLAVRERVNLLVGLVGPSGGGKTGSALELAHGMQDIFGGDIGGIDTEADRMKHYAGARSFSDPKRVFKFNHLSFTAPFGPLDYLAAIEHYVKKGVKTIIVDSMSHEHEGQGGVLEMHEAEMNRLADLWKTSPSKTTMAAWATPKAQRRQLINAILQKKMNFIFCFRAKEKIKIISGKDPVQLGWQPIAGEEFVYEMTLNCLLPPGANGVPEWTPEERAEKQMIKLPQQFRDILTPGRPLSIKVGQELATWAQGDGGQQPIQLSKRQAVIKLVMDHEASFTPDELATLRGMVPDGKGPDRDSVELLTAAENKAKEFLERAGVTV